ncbi:MAG: cytochrome C oxidase subunit IV family protein [Dehalococcoidia bacterium]|nr:cytochrome C oxidase subunit IV family protein [Dehalococcoidia bacterium]
MESKAQGLPAHTDTSEHKHPGPGKYILVGAALVMLTVTEVAVYYIASLRGVLVPLLLALSATKFSLVVLFYMHLKFDSRLFSGLFFGGLALACVLMLSLLLLFRVFVGG